MKDFEKQLDKNLKKKYTKKIKPTSEQVYHSDAVQNRMDKLANRMYELRDASIKRGLTVKQGEEFAESFVEYKKYADKFGVIIDSTFTDMAKELEKSMKPQFEAVGKTLRESIESGIGETIKNANKKYDKYYGQGERQAQQKKAEESRAASQQGGVVGAQNINQQLDETSSKLQQAQGDAQKLSDTIDDIGKSGGDAISDKVDGIAEKIHGLCCPYEILFHKRQISGRGRRPDQKSESR